MYRDKYYGFRLKTIKLTVFGISLFFILVQELYYFFIHSVSPFSLLADAAIQLLIIASLIELFYRYALRIQNRLQVEITERKLEEEQYRSTIDSMSDMIHVIGEDYRIILANRAISDWFAAQGLPSDVRDRNIFDIFPFLDDTVRQEYQTVFKSGRELITEETVSTGEVLHHTETRKIPVFEGGAVRRVVTVIQDVTGHKRLEEQLRHSQKMEAVGRLAGGIAHDFNNILTSIMGYTGILMASHHLSERQHNELRQIMKAAEMAASLTHQLLAFSRKQMLQPRVLDLNHLTDAVRKMLYRIIGEDIELVIQSSPEPACIRADFAQIEQVLMNLAVNAYDSMPGGGKLLISTGRLTIDGEMSAMIADAHPGKFVTLSVSDTGKGIDPNVINQIFEPFFTTKEPGKGTGLGLSVVYGIVKQHGGFISVESAPDRGATFTVYLPEFSESDADRGANTKPAQPIRGAGENILLVEDEEGVRTSVTRILQKNGYRVLTASNAREACALFDEHGSSIDLVFSDVVMPGASGIELVDILVSRKPDVRVLLGSGYTDEKSQWPLIREKGYRFLHKPYKFDHLLETISAILREKHGSAEN